VLQIWLSENRSIALAARRRRLIGPAGCGMCGLESLAEANRTVPTSSSSLQVDIIDAVATLPAKQELNTQTRAVHAAAFWQRHQSLVVREEAAGANLLTDLERIKWLLWHGNGHRAGETSGFFLDDVDALQVDYPNLHKLACAAHEFGV
jgi:hypothetical protein